MAKEISNILVNKIHDQELKRFASRYLSGQLIDIGCGTKPYECLLAPYISRHIGVDHLQSPHDKFNVDLIGSAYQIPVDDASFDCAISTAVLEHLEEPEKAIRECFRVLRNGGVAIYSVPFIWHLHEEPRDFYRYSKYGLKYLFEKVGFHIIEIKPLSGFWVTFAQLFVYNIYRFNLGPLRWLRIIDAFGALIQAIAYLLNKIDRSEQWTWMYILIARKP